jgi:T5orf172 domain
MPIIDTKTQERRAAWAAQDAHMLTTYHDRQEMEDSGGWIYAIEEDRTPLVKIGYTRFGTDHRLRCLAYAIQAPVTLVGVVAVLRDVGTVERRVHAFLAAELIGHEWFYTDMTQSRLEDLVAAAQRQLHLKQILRKSSVVVPCP